MTPIVSQLPESMPQPNHRDPAPWYPSSLQQAALVQQRLYPREIPRMKGWDVAAACRPAQVVAGDYYDLFELGQGRIAIALGDVSGKGLGPALVMAGVRAIIRAALPQRSRDLAGLMRYLNAYLFATTPDEMFVTLFLAVLDVHTGEITYVNAGHLPPLVLSSGNVEEPMRLTERGPVLGVFLDATFEDYCVSLRPGSLLAVCSDGVTEALDSRGRMFHERRLVEALQATSDKPAMHTLAHLLEAVERFRGHGEVSDDISVILLRRLAEGHTARE
jgi:sigma-B regulation protein RsbU (phosphoserine phosphatase)